MDMMRLKNCPEKKNKHKTSLNFQNDTVDSMPLFEYYDFENYMLCNYYYYMTLACQGGAFITGVLYRFYFIYT